MRILFVLLTMIASTNSLAGDGTWPLRAGDGTWPVRMAGEAVQLSPELGSSETNMLLNSVAEFAATGQAAANIACNTGARCRDWQAGVSVHSGKHVGKLDLRHVRAHRNSFRNGVYH